MKFHFEFTNLVGLLSLVGTVLGLAIAGTLYPSDPLLAIPFVFIGVGSIIMFVAFLYNYLKYAVYVMPAENFEDDDKKE